MAGLLYKDFVAIRGKLITLALLVITLFIAVFSMTVTSQDAVIVAVIYALSFSLLPPLIVVGTVEQSIFAADEGGKKKAWLMSLPIEKSQYVASKYIFILICEYVLLSFGIIWLYFINIPMEKAFPDSILMDVIGVLPLWAMACLLVSAVELPFFVGCGIRVGKSIKITILFVLYFAVIVYLLFGNLDVLDQMNLMALVTYLKEHVELFMALNVLTPVIVGGLYYLSYRISVALFMRKEFQDEE